MNKTGLQIQRLDGRPDDAPITMVRATRPRVLKLFRGAASFDLAREWRAAAGPDAPLVLRTVGTDQEPLSTLLDMVRDDVAWWGRFRAIGGVIILEVRWNERSHTDPAAFAELVAVTDQAVDLIAAGGFWPGVLITSEGNPPGPNFGVDYFLQPPVLAALRRWRSVVPKRYPGVRVIWCPHGYSHPPDPSDEMFHSMRPREILDRLPPDAQLNYLEGEDGCDGGTGQPDQRPGQGWRSYWPGNPAGYRYWHRAKRVAVALDPRCLGSALFLCGADPASKPPWDTFDVRDEVDLRSMLTEPIDGPPVAWLDPVAGGPPVDPAPIGGVMADVHLSVPEVQSHAVAENYEPGRTFGPCIGVVMHSTGGAGSTIENEYIGTRNWFQNPDAGVSAHRIVGGGRFEEVATSVHDDEFADHAGAGDRAVSENPRRRGLEIAHGDGGAWDAVAYTPFQYAAAAELIARWHLADKARGWHWPIVLLTRAQAAAGAPGVVYHRDTPAGIVWGRRDPTGPFDGARLIREALAWVATIEAGSAPAPNPPNPNPAPVPPAPGHWPNGRPIASTAEYDAHVWSPIMTAYVALMNGGNGALGDDDDAAALLAIKRRSEQRHGVSR